ncbi:MAG: glycosyltransferase family 39 protein [Cyanobacteria bacterium P01_D01_bin.36]
MNFKKLIIIGLLLIGLYARCANLGQKVYTVDEVRGIFRASGYQQTELIENAYTGTLITNDQLQAYQTPTAAHPVGDAMAAFANNPEHPPLYYLLMRFSLQAFKAPVASRWLAVVLSLLLLPAMYWLCIELFVSKTPASKTLRSKTLPDQKEELIPTAISGPAVGWSAIALIAISPFHVLLAQEARQYTLWALLLAVSSAFLLQALRENRWKQWLAYGVTAALGMYSHLFFTWVLMSHGLYVLIVEKFRLSQRLLRYALISTGVVITFLPWAWVIVSRASQLKKTTRWASTYKTSIIERAQYWLHNIGIGFIDFEWPVSFTNPLSYILLGAVVYSIYLLYRHTPKRVWLFVVLLMGISAAAQIVPDILSDGRRSLLPRYSLTVYIGIAIAVGYAMAHAFNNPNRKLQQAGVAALLIGGVVSSLLIPQSLGWAKGSSTIAIDVSPKINQVEQPIIISDTEYFYMLSLSYYVDPSTRYVLLNPEQPESYASALTQLPADSNLLVYSPSNELADAIQSSSSLESDITPLEENQSNRRGKLYQARRVASS